MILNEMFDVPIHYRKAAAAAGMNLTEATIAIFQQMDIIKKECQPFLKQAPMPFGKNALYRGMNENNIFLKKRVRLGNRRPTDMDFEMHGFLNHYFKKRFGEPFRNAMFASGATNQAEDYGKVYYVFPVGEFNFIWSKTMEDLYSIEHEYAELTIFPRDSEEWKDTFDMMADNVLDSYQTGDLSGAIRSGHEIMIRSESYIAIAEEIMEPRIIKACEMILRGDH